MAMSQDPWHPRHPKADGTLVCCPTQKPWHKSHFRQGVKIDQYLRPEAHLGSLGLGAQLLRLAVVMHPKNIENRMVHFVNMSLMNHS